MHTIGTIGTIGTIQIEWTMHANDNVMNDTYIVHTDTLMRTYFICRANTGSCRIDQFVFIESKRNCEIFEKMRNENNVFVKTIYQTLFIQRQFAMLEIFGNFHSPEYCFCCVSTHCDTYSVMEHIKSGKISSVSILLVASACVSRRGKNNFSMHTHTHAYYVVHGK